MNIHVHHHIEFDEGHPLYRLVQSVHHEVQALQTGMGVIMAQLDDLLAALNAISSDVDTTLSQIGSLETQLVNLQNSTPPEVDLSSAISLAGSIRQRLEGTQQQANNAASTPSDAQPTPETSPSDGGGEATASPSVDGSEAGGEPSDGAPV